ncbi:D-alanyl-D-alanine endopeptidase (penicillin-binding protein 7) [Variovorax sp. OK605]|jgi:D-alanyl-D-alanine endopeptidase (penicillin-binding protein 7)|uniref:serine hydrolase n=1 Tax=unclassified Variovorax TaxID=663243 RepID=UPI0008B3943B|nr:MULTISPECIES: serine hydrolase [unclassified Variovorax]SEJ69194.1 murein-DD-endopeptidase. Serine peptidase. MEROPS family S11 [Variovorax sp. OK202]SFC78864.1 murein-DD-endopeptidase. Serine peptidase. MEROPS family S11 [Variovorax sp. OK212]SFO60175.1 D-alanyl-D-alanine endopeptidase (penicillin-binding protein 7) [Variovorax sp. OK605]
MPEARLRRVSSQRFLPAFRFLAVALCATAFLLPGAQAAKKEKPAATKTAVAKKAKGPVPVEVKRSASSKTARAGRAEKPEKAEKVVRGGRNVVATLHKKNGKTVVAVQRRSVVRVETPPRQSFGQMAGLHGTEDVLDLKSSVALVIDQDTHEVLFSKNDHAVLPIASLTKLMTGLLISEAHLPNEELITITQDDVDTEKRSSSRLTVGTTLSRGELLHLALMSSENRAAHALGRTYPGGLSTFVSIMNAKAKMLGMKDTRYVEPTGLSSRNQSSAQDLALLVNAAYADATVRSLSTSPEYQVEVGNRMLQFNTTNRLVKSPDWEIGVQKTGYISEAGQCLVLQARVAGRKLIMVFLDSAGKFSRIADAERVRRWVEATHAAGSPAASRNIAAYQAG